MGARRHGRWPIITLMVVFSIACLAALGCSQPRSAETAASPTTTRDTVVTEGRPETEDKASESPSTAANARVVCIDAGHSSNVDLTQEPIGEGATQTRPRESGGAEGTTTGTPEYQIVLDVALKLQGKLEDKGYTVVMIRTTNDVDISSKERAAVANDCGADIFIRLHCDSAESSSPHGFSTLVPGENTWTEAIYQESQRAGEIMHPICVGETGAADAGIVERDDLAGFNYCTVPVVLFEMGFLSNPNEEQLLVSDEYQTTLASAISDATSAYLDQTPTSHATS